MPHVVISVTMPIRKCLFIGYTARHWKENLPSEMYAFLEGKVFQLNNFTTDGFSFH